MARPGRIAGLVITAGCVAGCLAGCATAVAGHPVARSPATADQSLIQAYFEHSNDAAHEGADAQREFLDSTQHPDVERDCDLGGLTLLLDPSLSTLRSDDGWRPGGTGRTPRGRMYVVAVTVTVQRGQSVLGIQVGSMHLAVLNGTAYGFAPCPE